ncbi:uncharacterized protein B0H18DRAFT_1011513 [Fomitopsis serialis]|uniref:uncharacterized protein n=1 Tax=Fomitopsis serialis TaxID=139415 RepID=UPI002008D464|nr:uncharacterized protein B0H18DRAFT_1011513 [Neoantrodia serialis]KAH9924517.1 hypothetical protein B0H18DRAFT_1011513 [Neoantrodia serialis]
MYTPSLVASATMLTLRSGLLAIWRYSLIGVTLANSCPYAQNYSLRDILRDRQESGPNGTTTPMAQQGMML